MRLRLSSLGSPETRAAYREQLQAHLRANAERLAAEVRERIELNPLRAFDSDDPGTRAGDGGRAAAARPPRRSDDAEHFAEVRELLDAAGVAYEIDPTLVRGLDYYTRTVFEFTSDALGAQSGVGGGGRYDGLVEQLGGPPTPGIGWAAGVERILLAAAEQRRPRQPASTCSSRRAGQAEPRRAQAAFAIAREARSGGPARADGAGRTLAEGPAQAGRAPRRALRCHRGSRRSPPARHAERRQRADDRPRTRSCTRVLRGLREIA